MTIDRVGRETDQLHAASGEFWLQLGERSQLRGADGRVVFRMGEKNNPVVANELVEVDWSIRCIGVEVGGNATQAKTAAAR